MSSADFISLFACLKCLETVWIDGVDCDFAKVLKQKTLQVNVFKYTDILSGEQDMQSLGLSLVKVTTVDFSGSVCLGNNDILKFI